MCRVPRDPKSALWVTSTLMSTHVKPYRIPFFSCAFVSLSFPVL